MASVLNTRPAAQAKSLSALLRANGVDVIEQPLLHLEASPNPDQAQAQLAAAPPDAAWIFVSANAVDGARALLEKLPPQATIIALGAATAQRIQQQFVRVAITPTAGNDSESILALPELNSPREVVIVCAPDGRDLIAITLRSRGKTVHEIYSYRRSRAVWEASTTTALRAAADPILLATSAAALEALADALLANGLEALRSARLIVVSERIAERAAALGFSKVFTARSASDAELLAMVLLPSAHD